MGNRNKLNWRKWLQKNQKYLTEECGLPLSVLETERGWHYFLEHCYYASIPNSGSIDIDIDHLPKEAANNLYQFLQLDMGTEAHHCPVVVRLHFLLKQA